LHSLVDYVVEDIDEGVVGETVADSVELEVECCEALRNLCAKGMWFLLILFEGGNEVWTYSV